MWIEAREVILDHGGRVALGIDRDEQRARAIRVGAERAQNLGDLEQRRRADVRAVGKAEKHQEGMTLQILVGDRLPVLIGELERSADGRDLLRDRRREPSGHDKDDAEAKHQPSEKCRAHHKDAGAACGHTDSRWLP